MALFDSLVGLILAIVVGGSVGIGASKLASSYLKRQDKQKVLEVIEGKVQNSLKLDGKTINVNKFTYKKDDGEIIRKVTLADIVEKASPQALNRGNKVPFWKCWIKKEMGEKKKK